MQKIMLAAAVCLAVSSVASAQTLSVSGAAAARGAEVTLGATSISQMADNTPVTNNGVSCGQTGVNTGENHFWRRFYLATDHSPGPTATVSSVTIALENGGPTGGFPVTVNVYTIPSTVAAETIPTAQLTLVGSGTGTLGAGGALSTATIPVTMSGTVTTATQDLVVEWTNGVGVTTVPPFFPGGNPSAQTHQSFLSAPGCGITEPLATGSGALAGFASAHWIMIVNGTGLPVSLQEFNVD
ncbi:hypothetical protein ACQQ2N_14905 [Dokdonella sp. MW10]|uniref:hypothetical protein n=1 Tax=Dokdonella sp. MW10 TaxID=2992926 RepID=UPI003F7E0DA5